MTIAAFLEGIDRQAHPPLFRQTVVRSTG